MYYKPLVIWNLDENEKDLKRLKFGQQFENQPTPENALKIALKIAPNLYLPEKQHKIIKIRNSDIWSQNSTRPNQ